HSFGAVMHVHVAEDGADVLDAKRRGYEGPLERLHAFGALPRGSILAHGVHLDERQVARAAELGLWLVHKPRANERNRLGYARSLRASARVALGTDGYPSDMAAEQRALVRLAREHGDDLERSPRRLEAGRALVAERWGGALPDLPSVALDDAAF